MFISDDDGPTSIDHPYQLHLSREELAGLLAEVSAYTGRRNPRQMSRLLDSFEQFSASRSPGADLPLVLLGQGDLQREYFATPPALRPGVRPEDVTAAHHDLDLVV